MAAVIASVLGLGYLPRKLWGSDNGAGTVGSAGAFIVLFVLGPLPPAAHGLLIIALLVIGWWTINLVLGDDKDPKWVAIDEVAGMALATIGLGLAAAIVAWAVFRLADIFKQLFPGVLAAERLPGATGVIADDVVAGLYGLGAGWLFQILRFT